MRKQRRERTWSDSSADEGPAGLSGARAGALAVGARVGAYVVEAPLGEGGSARVWRVRHVELGVLRALKVLRRDHLGGAGRLAREARLQAEIDHPHVVRVHDVLDVGGRPALVMAFSDGGSLWDALEQGPMDEARAAQIGRDMARGLKAIHARGVVHRDVKPSNVLLMGSEGRAALTDFGVAREVGSDETQTGEVLGTPSYMAPEQLRSTATVGPTADMYAFGVVLYELLVGERPPPSAAQIAQRLANRPPPIAELIQGCLSPEPEARPDAARALDVLTPTAAGGDRRRVLWAGVALVTLCLAASWLGAAWLGAAWLGAAWPGDAWFGARSGSELPPTPAPTADPAPTQAAPLRRALERLGTDPGEVAALWRAAQGDGPAALDRALWDAGGDVRVIPTQDEIVDIFTTPDGQRLVGLTTRGWIHVWDRGSGERIFAMDSAAGQPLSAHLSGDGRLVAVVPHSARSLAGSRSQVRVLDLTTGKVVFTASNGDTRGATYFAFSPDSTRALTYSNGRSMTVWDVRSGAQIGRLDLSEANCSKGVAFDPESRRVATLGIDGRLRIYDEALGLLSESPVVRGAPACALRWTVEHGLVLSAGGSLVRIDPATGAVSARASGVGDMLELGRDRIVAFDRRGVQILDAATLAIQRALAHPKGILDVELDASGEQLATAGVDGVVRVWSTRTGRLLRALEGHRSWVHALAGDAERGWSLWSAGRDRTLRAWRLPEPEGAAFDFAVERVQPRARGRLVLGWGADAVSVHALDTRQAALRIGSVAGEPPRKIRASADGEHLLVLRRDHLVLHDLDRGAEGGRRLPIGPGFDNWIVGGDPVRLILANTGILRRIDVGEDGMTEVRWAIERNPSHVGQTRDGQRLFMASFDRTLTVWQIGAEQRAPEVFEVGCSQPSFIEPVGQRELVVGDWSGCIERWDLATGTRTARWSGHDDAITRVEAGPGGWVSSGLDGTLRSWGPDGQGQVLGRHDGGVLGFTWDGDRVISIGADRAIRSWSPGERDPGPVEYLPSRPRAIWGAGDAVQVVDEDGLLWSRHDRGEAPWGNLRVCPETLEVVPVVPFPGERGAWAPEAACAKAER